MNGRTGLKGLILKICDLAPVKSAIRDVRKQEIGALKDCLRLNAFGEKYDTGGSWLSKKRNNKHKVLRTIQYFWMTSSFRCLCHDVVNRSGGMIPEVVGVPRGWKVHVYTLRGSRKPCTIEYAAIALPLSLSSL